MRLFTLVLEGLAAAVLIYVSITDLRQRRIPNRIMFPALLLALAAALIRPERAALLLGGLAAGGLFLIPTLIYGLERAGGGDVKLALFIGLILGWPAIFPALLITFLSAAIFTAGGLLLRKLTRRSVIAFGPFLAFGGLVVGLIGLIGR